MRGRSLRVISETNEQLGIISFGEAIDRAARAGLDLVEVAGRAEPPVCRIMNFGKFMYEENKKLKDAKKNQHLNKIKEIKFHPSIDKHDYQTKISHVIEFLQKGFKVKISMFFRGREMAHAELGVQVLDRVIQDTKNHGIVEGGRRQAGRAMSLVIAPGAPPK